MTNNLLARNNNTVHWAFTFADGTVVTRKCRDSFGGFARLVREVGAEFGQWADVQQVQGF
jgi:hypothetical protein